MKDIFLALDFDGVLNSNSWCWTRERTARDEWAHIDPDRIKILNTLVSVLDCKIVISSTYRILHNLADLRFGLRSKGFEHSHRVVGKTDQKGGPYMAARGCEIQRWMDKYPDHKLVIIDDSTDMGHLLPFLVRTNPDTGIVESDIEKAVEIVNGQ